MWIAASETVLPVAILLIGTLGRKLAPFRNPQASLIDAKSPVGADNAAACGSRHPTLGHMTDFLSRETRSAVMSRIRSKDTKPEMAMRQGLWACGTRGWRCHPRRVPGKPDLAFVGLRIAVFVDGRFWHGHPDYFTFGKSGSYWDAKITRTQERDRRADQELLAQGWTVLRFWDFELEQDPARCVEAVASAVALARKGGRPESRLPIAATRRS